MEDILNKLKNLKYDLDAGLYSVTLSDKLELIASFIKNDLSDTIDEIDDGIRRIDELESELEEAKERIEELEREIDAAV